MFAVHQGDGAIDSRPGGIPGVHLDGSGGTVKVEGGVLIVPDAHLGVGIEIQPVEFIVKNDLEFLPGCIIKRICRFNQLGGKGLEDLEKIKREVDLLIELKYGGGANKDKGAPRRRRAK